MVPPVNPFVQLVVLNKETFSRHIPCYQSTVTRLNWHHNRLHVVLFYGLCQQYYPVLYKCSNSTKPNWYVLHTGKDGDWKMSHVPKTKMEVWRLDYV